MTLLSGSQPFMLRPYRYSHDQKDVIEQMVRVNLVFPLLLSLLRSRMRHGGCVDCRRLNAVTSKNKYSNLAVGDFLDELRGRLV